MSLAVPEASRNSPADAVMRATEPRMVSTQNPVCRGPSAVLSAQSSNWSNWNVLSATSNTRSVFVADAGRLKLYDQLVDTNPLSVISDSHAGGATGVAGASSAAAEPAANKLASTSARGPAKGRQAARLIVPPCDLAPTMR